MPVRKSNTGKGPDMAVPDDILKKALALIDKEIDALWAGEVESRIEGLDRGRIEAVTSEKVLEKYNLDEP